MSMRVFIVGDYKTGTGPANVTKEYIRCFPKGTLFQKMTGKISRVPELLVKTAMCDCILFSGYSAQNVLGIKFAKLFKKKTAYLVHGAITHENKINDNENLKMSDIEEKTLKDADLLLAVSEKFSEWMKAQYPQYNAKIDYVTNGVDFEYLRSLSMEYSDNTNNADDDKAAADSVDERDAGLILSVGGGMPRKEIIHICEAISIYNSNHPDKELTLAVIGADGRDTEAIKNYPFVDYLGMVPAKKKEELYRKANVFIQNSCFETFGLAVFEALMSGCSVLTSNVAGALDLLKDADDADIIYDYRDAKEIEAKIEYLLDNPNCDRLKNMIDEGSSTWEKRSVELLNKLSELTKA